MTHVDAWQRLFYSRSNHTQLSDCGAQLRPHARVGGPTLNQNSATAEPQLRPHVRERHFRTSEPPFVYHQCRVTPRERWSQGMHMLARILRNALAFSAPTPNEIPATADNMSRAGGLAFIKIAARPKSWSLTPSVVTKLVPFFCAWMSSFYAWVSFCCAWVSSFCAWVTQ